MFKTIINTLLMLEKNPKDHYNVLRRNFVIVMLLITILPLSTMVMINYYQYRSHLRSQIISPLYAMAEKTRHSFELFMEQHLATIRFIAATYNFKDLSDEHNMQKILISLKKEWKGFVDIGLINNEGELVSYAGPYKLLGKNYSEQVSFQETCIKGNYISNVFLGHRKYPHIVIAVRHMSHIGRNWIIRATIDTDFFDGLIRSMGLPRLSDAFLLNRDGVLQTNSLYFGNTLDKLKITLPRMTAAGSASYTEIIENDQQFIVVSSAFSVADYILAIVQPQSVALKSWYALKTEMIVIFFISLFIIIFAIIKMADVMVDRIKTSDERREAVLEELQHAQKLSSIGRLAAGVAHEINNPLAIINEKAGLMSDLIDLSKDFDKKDKFTTLTRAILSSVDRCRKITHRLLGFSKRIDVKIEEIDLNLIIHEVLDFLEKDILYRKVDIRLHLSDTLMMIRSDHGQIQQILVNLLGNAFAAVDEMGRVDIRTENLNKESIQVSIADNGCGMSKDVMKNIFDPFFSTKKEKGTGLGLSISYGIINKLGGQINVESELGKGSTFSIVLPVAPKDSEQENE